tara:strand:- start:121 stop:735 length:615 start_codon:yes stop_codon:yes gene_type:complete
MITIVITGPSCSGKTYLSYKLSKIFPDSIVLKTDSYYRDNKWIRVLSLFLNDIYDRPFSIKIKELRKTIRSIYNKEELISFCNYDFKRKRSSKSKTKINFIGNPQFLILEGIFAHRLNLNYYETVNIVCEESKEICFKRIIKRDQIERGKNQSDIEKNYNNSWYLYCKHINKFIKNNQVILLNPSEVINFNKLVNELNIIKKNN